MRILFLSQEHPRFGPTGGIGSYIEVMTPVLATRGHEVHVLVCRGDSSDDLIESGVQVHLRPTRSIPALRGVSRLSLTHKRLSTARSVAAALPDLPDFDAIESPEWMAESLFIGARHRGKVVVQLHTSIGVIARHGGYLGRDARLADRLERRTIERAAAVTSPSVLLADELRKTAPLREDVEIVRLPVDVDDWVSDHAEEQREPTVLFAGRLEERKGLDVLIEAMALLPEGLRDTKVIAVGASSGRVEGMDHAEWLVRLARERGVRFEHQQPRSREELRVAYASAGVLAVPSRFDSFSMVAAEGMAAGAPLVCTTTCGVSELIAGSGAGRAVPPGDPVGLRDAIQALLEDPSAARRTGEVGRSIVREHCAPEVVAAQRERVYGSVGG